MVVADVVIVDVAEVDTDVDIVEVAVLEYTVVDADDVAEEVAVLEKTVVDAVEDPVLLADVVNDDENVVDNDDDADDDTVVDAVLDAVLLGDARNGHPSQPDSSFTSRISTILSRLY